MYAFLSNDVNGLRSSKERAKMFEHFKCQIVNNGIFLQETHFQRLLLMSWGTTLKERCFFRTVQKVLAV